MRSQRFDTMAALAMVLLCIGADIKASTIYSWHGAYEGWSTPTSWVPNGVPNIATTPGTSVNVVIDNSAAPTLDVNAQVTTLAVGATTGQSSGLLNTQGKTLTVDQNATNAGTIFIDGGGTLAVTGDLANPGILRTNVGGQRPSTPNLINIGGTLTNSGTLELGLPGVSADTLTANTLISSGRFSVGPKSSVAVNSELDITGGTFLVSGTITGLSNLNSFTGGRLALVNNSLNETPSFNSGTLAIETATLELDATSLSINGNLNNAGSIITGGIYAHLGPGPSALNVTGALTNSGVLRLITGDAASIGTLTNTGDLEIGTGATVNLTNQPAGITAIGATAQVDVGGKFTAGSNSALANLDTVNGSLTLHNGETLTSTPGSGTFTVGPTGLSPRSNPIGVVNITNTNWTIARNVLNNGSLTTAGGQFTTTGTFTNQAGAIFTAGGISTVGTLLNSGTVMVSRGGTLNAGNGFTDIASGTELNLFGIYNTGGANALANLSSVKGALVLANNGAISTPASGVLDVTGTVYVGSGTNWTINGDLHANAQGFAQYTQSSGITNNGTITVTGDVTSNSLLLTTGVVNARNFNSTFLVEGSGAASLHLSGAYTQTGPLTFLPTTSDFTASEININNGTFSVGGFSANTLNVANGGSVSGQQASLGAPLDPGVDIHANPKLTIYKAGVLTDNGSVNFGDLINAGAVTVGATGTLTASTSYTQTDGKTDIEGVLISPSVAINGGTLTGAGTIEGSAAGGATDVSLFGGVINRLAT